MNRRVGQGLLYLDVGGDDDASYEMRSSSGALSLVLYKDENRVVVGRDSQGVRLTRAEALDLAKTIREHVPTLDTQRNS